MSFSKKQIKGDVPIERSLCTATAVGNRVFIFGGTKSFDAFADVHVLNTDTWTCTRATASGNVPALWGHSATLIDNNRILVFGGDAVGGKVADIYFFDIDKYLLGIYYYLLCFIIVLLVHN